MGPTVSNETLTGRTPRLETRPCVGRNPATPQNAAGMRIEPPVSVPSAASQRSSATATAEPPLDPPGTWSGFQGLRHWPATASRLRTPKASSIIAALPIMTAPARRRRSTTGASAFGIWSAKSSDPQAVRIPAVSMLSLTAMVMPWSRPSQRPSVSAPSTSCARRRAPASSTVANARKAGFKARIRSSFASTRSLRIPTSLLLTGRPPRGAFRPRGHDANVP